MEIIEREIEFESQGEICRGLFVRPAQGEAAPLVVLSHGLGAVYEMRLDAYAREFAEAGYAALTFDYRRFGRSDGEPRHWLVREHQQQDIEAAIAYGRTLAGVDPTRIVLWGSSLAGGHMIDVTAKRNDITATIIQGPFTDGLASARAISLMSLAGVSLFVGADVAARLLGRPPVLVPLAGTRGTPAMMTAEDVLQGALALLPDGSTFSARLSGLFEKYAAQRIRLGRNVSPSDTEEKYDNASLVGSVNLPSGTVLINGVSALFAARLPFWQPGKKLKKLRSPMLICVCDGDSVAPSDATLKHARHASYCEVKRYPFGHFDIYTGQPFTSMVADQLDFLRRVVPVTGQLAESIHA